MRKLAVLLMSLFLIVTGAFGMTGTKDNNTMYTENNNEKILFINGSARRDGNTAALAKTLLEGHDYEYLSLPEYRINVYGQTLPGDQFETVIGKMREADVVVIGSPVYWLTICASVRTLMERFHGAFDENSFKGKKLFFLFQGGGPTKEMLDSGDSTMRLFARMYGFTYEGMANDESQAQALRNKL